MTLHTARGWPYPDGADPVAQLKDVAVETATLLEARVGLIQRGSFTVNLTGGVGQDRTVTFPEAFDAVPVTWLVPVDASTTFDVKWALRAVPTVNDALFRIQKSGSSGNVTFYWFAIG